MGKGTQAALLSKHYGVINLSTGEVLRSSLSNIDKPINGSIASVMSKGGLVSDEIVENIVKERITKLDCADGFILDGFPRNNRQARALDEILQGASFSDREMFVVNIVVSHNELIQRLSGRFTCIKCNKSYNKWLQPTKIQNICDACGSTSFNYRDDDTIGAITERLNVYNNETSPLVEYYSSSKSSGTFIEVNGIQEVNKVFQDIIIAIDHATKPNLSI